jgi:transcriptional regulator with XRE-family HTH domain
MAIDLSKKIKKAMLDKGIKQKELARRLGVSQATVSQFLQEGADLRKSTIEKIWEALDMPVNYSFNNSVTNTGDNNTIIKGAKNIESPSAILLVQKEVELLKKENELRCKDIDLLKKEVENIGLKLQLKNTVRGRNKNIGNDA